MLLCERAPRFARSLSRWIERWLAETEGATVDDPQEIVQALVHVDDGHVYARLGAIFDARGSVR